MLPLCVVVPVSFCNKLLTEIETSAVASVGDMLERCEGLLIVNTRLEIKNSFVQIQGFAHRCFMAELHLIRITGFNL